MYGRQLWSEGNAVAACAANLPSWLSVLYDTARSNPPHTHFPLDWGCVRHTTLAAAAGTLVLGSAFLRACAHCKRRCFFHLLLQPVRIVVRFVRKHNMNGSGTWIAWTRLGTTVFRPRMPNEGLMVSKRRPLPVVVRGRSCRGTGIPRGLRCAWLASAVGGLVAVAGSRAVYPVECIDVVVVVVTVGSRPKRCGVDGGTGGGKRGRRGERDASRD
jgi:hypothetical protein